MLDIARKEFADGRDIVTIEETALEKEWPPLRTELNTAVKAWRLKGLELMGLDPRGRLPARPGRAESLNNFPEPATSPATPATANHSPGGEGRGEGGLITPVPFPSPRTLEVRAEDTTLFAGLPLFDLAS